MNNLNLKEGYKELIELLRNNCLPSLRSYHELDSWLNQISKQSPLACHWVHNFIKPMFMILSYIRAEREGNFALNLFTYKQMIPYFFAANHHNYARYSVHYLSILETLPQPVLKCFLDGEHVVRQIDGIWNAIWTDMLIETQYMRYGKGRNGIIGLTTNQGALQVWAKSHHSSTTLLKELNELRNKKEAVSVTHKQEGVNRINNDSKDRMKLQKAIETCVHPLKDLESPMCNIFSGEIAAVDVNVQSAFEKGKEMASKFQSILPDGFFKPICKQIITIGKTNEKSAKVQSIPLDTEIILTRVLFILNREVALDNIFSYELAPMPTSLFKTNMEANYPSNKSVLLNSLKIEHPAISKESTCFIIDGGSLIYNTHWPTGSCAEEFAKGVLKSISRKLATGDVYVIFDKYRDFSTKSDTRKTRVSAIKKLYLITKTTPLPPRELVLSSNQSKSQLIDLVCNYIIEELSNTLSHHMYLTWESSKVVKFGKVYECREIQSHQEEADTLIPLQVNHAIQCGHADIQIHSEDTDVFCLLIHFCHSENWTASISMVSKHWCIDINKSTAAHTDLLKTDILNFP